MNDKKILLVGLGNQGKAWALNLRDSKVSLWVFRRCRREEEDNPQQVQFLKDNHISSITSDNQSALREISIVLLLCPDHLHSSFFKDYGDLFAPGTFFIYAHGFSVMANHLPEQYPQFQHLLLAPKAIASAVRFQYESKGKLAAVSSSEFANDQAMAEEVLRELAQALGVTTIFERSFREETNADLLSEQSLLCSLIPIGAMHCFETLKKRGVSNEVAYIESWHEVKLIADAMIKFGPTHFFELISPNAFYGGLKASEKFFDKQFQKKLEQLSEDIWSGKFSKQVSQIDVEEMRRDYLKNISSSDLQMAFNKIKDKLI